VYGDWNSHRGAFFAGHFATRGAHAAGRVARSGDDRWRPYSPWTGAPPTKQGPPPAIRHVRGIRAPGERVSIRRTAASSWMRLATCSERPNVGVGCSPASSRRHSRDAWAAGASPSRASGDDGRGTAGGHCCRCWRDHKIYSASTKERVADCGRMRRAAHNSRSATVGAHVGVGPLQVFLAAVPFIERDPRRPRTCLPTDLIMQHDERYAVSFKLVRQSGTDGGVSNRRSQCLK